MSRPAALAFLLATLALAQPASAHHSFAMFDQNKVVTLTGTIKSVRWANPHVWIDMIVAAPGPQTSWGIEAGATQTLVRQGWKRDSIKPGDKVTFDIHPMRSGANSGSLMKAILADGHVLSLGAQGAQPES